MKMIPAGIDSFTELRRLALEASISSFVDKTEFIAEWLSRPGDKVTLITRPIRFMKSTNLSMLATFLDVNNAEENAKLFEGLKISEPQYAELCKKHQGKYPVVLISFKDIKGVTLAEATLRILRVFSDLFKSHFHLKEKLDSASIKEFENIVNKKYLLDELADSLLMLTKLLKDHYKQPVMVLIDEFDTPLHHAHVNNDDDPGYYDKILDFMKNLLGPALKTNTSLARGVMTGVLRTAFGSLVSALNNVKIYSVLEIQYAKHFGITIEELDILLDQLDINDPKIRLYHHEIMKSWYNGYDIAGIKLYNPWSIACYLDDPTQPKAYWLQTGDSGKIGQYLKRYANYVVDAFEQLALEKTLTVTIDSRTVFDDLIQGNAEAFWGLMLNTGYVTAYDVRALLDTTYRCKIGVPNNEVLGAILRIIKNMHRPALASDEYEKMINALLDGKIDVFEDYLKNYMLEAASCFDMSNTDIKLKLKAAELGKDVKDMIDETGAEVIIPPERIYHVFMLGILVGMHGNCYRIRSNRESGFGRYDIMLMPVSENEPGFIFEFKKASSPDTLGKAADDALAQIAKKQYATELRGYGVKHGIHIGIGFCGKAFELKHVKEDYKPDLKFRLPGVTAHESMMEVVPDLE